MMIYGIGRLLDLHCNQVLSSEEIQAYEDLRLRSSLMPMPYGYIKNHKKTVKNGQARKRESEEYKAEARKVKPQSKSAKKSQSQSKMVNLSQTQKDKSSKCFTLVPQLSQKSKNVPSPLIGP
ncbi:hypothetical protein Tco_0343582 [Tanacetum coccineum]